MDFSLLPDAGAGPNGGPAIVAGTPFLNVGDVPPNARLIDAAILAEADHHGTTAALRAQMTACITPVFPNAAM